jgi:hypothetical protein
MRRGIETTESMVDVTWSEAGGEELRARVAAGESDGQIAGRMPGRTLGGAVASELAS